MASIIWLASYPKSGNTWVRAFLTNYLRDGLEPADINDLEGGQVAANRHLFDEFVGIEASDLLPHEVRQLRPAAYAQLAQEREGTIVLKVHDPYDGPDGIPLFPPHVGSVIYVVRNPLDVAVSLAHHSDWPVERVVASMCQGFSAASHGERLHEQLEQRLPPWGEHVRGWIEAPRPGPIHVVRYEDLVRTPATAFRAMLESMAIEVTDERLSRAIEFSRFDALRSQEEAKGFRERPPHLRAFFRSGRIGEGRQVLTVTQVRDLIATHSDMMRRFRYLDEGAG